jgi:hypothetical protein
LAEFGRSRRGVTPDVWVSGFALYMQVLVLAPVMPGVLRGGESTLAGLGCYACPGTEASRV